MFLSINNNTCLLALIRKNVAVQNFREAVVVLFLLYIYYCHDDDEEHH